VHFCFVYRIQKAVYSHLVQLVLCKEQFTETVLYFFAPMVRNTWSRVMEDSFELGGIRTIILNGTVEIVPGGWCTSRFRS